MTEKIVYCPYCLLGCDFPPMLPKPGGWLICQKCGHTVMPKKQEFKCFCQKCGELHRARDHHAKSRKADPALF